jgi:hypothetical protein
MIQIFKPFCKNYWGHPCVLIGAPVY